MKEMIFSRFRALFFFVGIIAQLLFLSCSGAKNVRNNSNLHASALVDSAVSNAIKHTYTHACDSVYVRDSIIVTARGDTVYVDRWHTRYVYKLRDNQRIDTVIAYRSKVQTDTVVVTKSEFKSAAKPQTAWQRIKDFSAGLTIFVLIMFLLILAAKRSRK